MAFVFLTKERPLLFYALEFGAAYRFSVPDGGNTLKETVKKGMITIRVQTEYKGNKIKGKLHEIRNDKTLFYYRDARNL